MDDEIMRKIERSRADVRDIDVVELLKGNKDVLRDEGEPPGKKIETTELSADLARGERGCIACSANFVVYTSSRNSIMVAKINGMFKEIAFEKDLVSLRLYEEKSVCVALVFGDNTGVVLTINAESLHHTHFELCNGVFQVEKGWSDFYVLVQTGNLFQIQVCPAKARVAERPMQVVVDGILSNKTPRFVFFGDDLYFMKNSVLHNARKESTRISCLDFVALDEFLVVLDTKKKKRILYLVNKDLQVVHEAVFSEEDVLSFRGAGNVIVVSVGYKIYVYRIQKGKFKLMEILNFDNAVLNVDVLVQDLIEVFVLTGRPQEDRSAVPEARAKTAERMSPDIRSKESIKTESASGSMEEILRGVVGKLVLAHENERKERELSEKRKMDMLLEKISEQLNKNLKIILETAVKKEMRPIVEKFESEVLAQIEKKIQSRIDTAFRGQENAFVNCAKKVLVQNIVPVVEAGFEEMKLQILESIQPRAAAPELAVDLGLLKIDENKETKLFNLIQRSEIIKGVELVLDSNEEVFETFLNTFECKFLKYLEPNTIFELFRKALLFNMCNKNARFGNFLDFVVAHIVEDPAFRKYFATHANEDLLSMVPSANLLPIYAALLADASKSYKPECFVFLVEILKNFDTHVLDVERMCEFSDLLDLTVKTIDTMGYQSQTSEAYLVVQKNYLKKKLRTFDAGSKNKL